MLWIAVVLAAWIVVSVCGSLLLGALIHEGSRNRDH